MCSVGWLWNGNPFQWKAKIFYHQVNVFKWSKFLEKFHFVRKKIILFLFEASSLKTQMSTTHQRDRVLPTWVTKRQRFRHWGSWPLLPLPPPQARGHWAYSSMPLRSSRDWAAWLLLHLCPFYLLFVFYLFCKANSWKWKKSFYR